MTIPQVTRTTRLNPTFHLSTVSESTHPQNKTLKVMKCLESFKYEHINYCFGKIYKEDTLPHCSLLQTAETIRNLTCGKIGVLPNGLMHIGLILTAMIFGDNQAHIMTA
jgi:hypothetical protein